MKPYIVTCKNNKKISFNENITNLYMETNLYTFKTFFTLIFFSLNAIVFSKEVFP